MSASVILACTHTLLWRDHHHAPKHGERVYCYACADLRTVVGRHGEYVVRCHDCRYDGAYVTDARVADGVKRHLVKFPSHVVNVTRAGMAESVDVALGPDHRTGLETSTDALF